MYILVKWLFFSLLFYLIYSSTKKPGIKKDWLVNETINKLFGGKKKLKIISYLENILNASNVRKYIPFMNVPCFIFGTFCFICFFSIFSFNITNSPLISVAVGTMTGYIPKLLLDILIVINGRKIKKIYLSFLNVFYGFYNLDGDIVGAFRRASDYTGEPLRSFIKRIVYRYDHSNIEFSECLDELADGVRDREFAKFIKFTKLHLIYGGDYKKALEKLIDQARRLEVVRTSKTSSAVVGIFVILCMSILDLIGLVGAYIFNPDVAFFLKYNFLGQILAFINLATVCIGYYIAAGFYRG